MDNNWTDVFLAVAIGVVSFGIGMNLKFKDFKRVITRPRAILTGLFCQMILLPLIAFALIYFWPIEPIYKLGFILIAACPGGTMSNFVTFALKGRVPLSVSLTAFNSFLILFSIPLILEGGFLLFTGSGQRVELGFWETFSEVFFSVILPVMGGISINELTTHDFKEKLEKPMRYIISVVLISAVAVVLWFDESQQSSQIMNNLHLMIPLLALNIITMAVGFFVSGYLKLDHRSSFTVAIEMGLQNSALAIFIANSVLDEPKMSMVAILYGSFSLFSTWGIAYIFKSLLKPKTILNW